jgi:branched-chain amino acid transport system substrate-binding protein
VLVTVAGNSAAGRYRGMPTLPLSTCGEVRYQGSEDPDLILASDLPLDRPSAFLTTPIVNAIEQVLRAHHYRAGGYRVAYQSCDDSTEQVGTANSGKCQANARSFAETASVIAVIGTFNSDCAKAELPILSSATDPVALVSPSNSYPGLTSPVPGVTADEPERYYPDGTRQYFRVYPRDDQPAQAEAVMAQRLHLRKVFVFLDDPQSRQWQVYAQAFAERARALGVEVLGPSSRPTGGDFTALVRRLQRSRVDGVMLAGSLGTRGYLLTLELRRVMGQSVAIFGTPDYLAVGEGDENLTGVYTVASGVTSPAQLGPAGRQFWRAFEPAQAEDDDLQFAPYAAQATELLLAAIARSDGSRGSVISELRRARVTDGILGDFTFTKGGDMSASVLPIYRLTPQAEVAAVLLLPG